MSTHEPAVKAPTRILLAGTGGQGVITAAKLLSDFFVERGHEVVSGQLHGMAQRGGAVQSSVLVDCGMSPIIPRGGADVVLGFEPAETARALPFISAGTVVLMNTAPVIPFILSQQFVLKKGDGLYPDIDTLTGSIHAITPFLFTLPVTHIAEEAGAAKSVNIIMLGCLFGAGVLPYSPDDFLGSVMRKAPPHIAEKNTATFLLGVDVGRTISLPERIPCP